MVNYINARLMQIDEDRVVVIDGVEYLVLNEDKKPEVKKAVATKKKPVKKQSKKYPFLAEAEAAILTVLREHPNLRSAELRSRLEEEHKLMPPVGTLSSLCARMKKDDLLEVNGVKANARWALKKKEVPAFNLNISQ